MTETWSVRLVAAMEADPPFPELEAEPDTDGDPTVERFRAPSDDVTGQPRTDGTSDSVAGHIITAAAIGYPTADDVGQILRHPGALAQLAQLWTSMPPDPDLLSRAAPDSALDQLLTATGHRADGVQPTTPDAPTRLASRRQRRSYALGAADEAERHTQAWPGGQLVRQRLDRTISVNVDYAGADGAGRVLRLTTAADPFRLLLMLTADPTDPTGAAVGQSAVSDLAALDAVTIEGPFDPSDLTEADLAALPDSVAWARGESVVGWRQAARLAGPDSPLHRAAVDGRRRGVNGR